MSAGCADCDKEEVTSALDTELSIYDNQALSGFVATTSTTLSQSSCSAARFSSPPCSFMAELRPSGAYRFSKAGGVASAGWSHLEFTFFPNRHWLGGFGLVVQTAAGRYLPVVPLNDGFVTASYPDGFKRLRVPMSVLNPSGEALLAIELRNISVWNLRRVWLDELRLRGTTTGPAPAPVPDGGQPPVVGEPSPPPAPTAGTPRFFEDFESYAVARWAGSTGKWNNEYGGDVGIELDGSRVHYQRPQASTQPDETHANLIVTSQSFSGDLDFSVRMKTVQQLRRNSTPNNWEVAWVGWNYQRDEQFYYFTVKPQGFELGKSDDTRADPSGPECSWPEYRNCRYPGAQRYLATGGGSFPIGRWYTVRVKQSGGTMQVFVDGVLLTTVTDTINVLSSGRLALYNEDSWVRFDDVCVRSSAGEGCP